MSPRNHEHAGRVLDHLEAQDAQQWPIGTTAAVPLRSMNERDLAAMLKRATNHLASLALLDVGPEVKRTAEQFCNEAKALLRRIGGK